MKTEKELEIEREAERLKEVERESKETVKPEFTVKKELGSVEDIINDSLNDLESVEELSNLSDVSNPSEVEKPVETPNAENITEKDKSGKTFNPSLHAAENGKPIYTPTGRFKKLTGSPNAESKAISEQLKSQAVMLKATGETLAGLYFIAGGTVIGSDFEPESSNEKEQISALFANYLQSKEMKDLPAGWALMIGLGVHAIGKARKPKAQTRLGHIGKKIKGFFIKTTGKPKKKNEDKEEKEVD